MKRYGIFLGLLLSGVLAQAQEPPTPPPPPAAAPVGRPGRLPRAPEPPPPPQASRPPMERALGGVPHGRWWNNPEMAQKLGLSADQQKRMDDIFQQNRLKLVDLHAAVQKEEINMEPLMSADQPDEARIVAQIDRVAQARAELEKANARFLLGIRRVLTTDQYRKLQAEHSGVGIPQPAPVPRLPHE
jgi:Spy/CpxP family protein refolding chaperone